MKAYWGSGGEWSASRLGRFTPKERSPGTLWIGGWLGPRAVLDAVVKRKIPSPRRKSNPRTPIVYKQNKYEDCLAASCCLSRKTILRRHPSVYFCVAVFAAFVVNVITCRARKHVLFCSVLFCSVPFCSVA
jgi:hypothetical protein